MTNFNNFIFLNKLIRIKYFIVICITVLIGLLNFIWLSYFLQGGILPSKKIIPVSSVNFDSLYKYFDNYSDNFSYNIDSSKNVLVQIKGYRNFTLNSLDNSLNGGLHINEELQLFSLSYVYPMLADKRFLDKLYAQQLIGAVEATLKYVDNKTFIPKLMKANDHVVSVRLENLILFYSFINTYHPKLISKSLQKNISTNILWCYRILNNKDYFNWKTNHGLIQLKALLSFSYAYPEFAESSSDFISQNILKLLKYHIAKDGSVYEGASGYWYFIYDQFRKISNFPNLSKSSRDIIVKQLEHTKKFLNHITMPNGYLQGIGDTYSAIKCSSAAWSDTISVYKFSNGIGGINYIDKDSSIFNILFTSLYNPPNVHNLPEDLSVYIYYNQPYFINSGIFAYDGSSQRKSVSSQHVQNTVFNQNKSNPDSSNISIKPNFTRIIELDGFKFYGKDFIKRRLIFFPSEGYIKIIDSTSNKNCKMTCCYNIAPGNSLTFINNRQVIMNSVGRKDSIFLSSNTTIKIDTGIISPSPNLLQKIQRIKIEGDSIIETVINLPFKHYFNNVNIINNDSNKDRLFQSYSFSRDINNDIIRSQPNKLILSRLGIIFIYIIFSFVLNYRVFRTRYLIIFSSVFILLFIIDISSHGLIISSLLIRLKMILL